MNEPSKTRLVVVGLLLAVGIGVVWGFGLAAMGSMISSVLFEEPPIDYEDLVLDDKGNPVVQVRIRGDYRNVEFRTLEGVVIELPEEKTYYPTPIRAPYLAPGIVEYPIAWTERIAGMNGAEKPPLSWVAVRDARRPGRAYLVGYDSETNQRVGYIGTGGFSSSTPLESERFDVGGHSFEPWDCNLIASTGNVNFGALSSRYPLRSVGSEHFLQPWQVFVCDGDQIREINLKSREVSEVQEFEGLVGVSVFTEGAGIADQNMPEHRLLVRCLDRFLVYDPFQQTKVEFKIPQGLQNEPLSVSAIDPEHLMLHHNSGRWERGIITDLVTVSSTGEVKDTKTVRLVSYVSNDSVWNALGPAAVAPTLLPWLLGIFLVAPLVMLQEHEVTDYAAGAAYAWDAAWIGLMLVFVLSVVLATIVYRWQQKYSRPNTPLWTTFVFLTTLPGFLAYWVMHRREPMGACQHCGASIPVDRDKCAKCAAPLPEPKLLGREIFA